MIALYLGFDITKNCLNFNYILNYEYDENTTINKQVLFFNIANYAGHQPSHILYVTSLNLHEISYFLIINYYYILLSIGSFIKNSIHIS